MASKFEDEFTFQLSAAGLPRPEAEYKFAAPRRWRFDFAYPGLKLAIELEGGIWTDGRHTRGSGFEGDCEKYNEAALRSWKVLRFTGAMIKDGRALRTVERALGR